MRTLGFVVVLAVGVTGCAAEVGARGIVETPAAAAVYAAPSADLVVFHEEPTLVTLGGGVAVVEDWDAPVYFVDGAYWYPRDGVWYTAAHWNEPWERVEVGLVPVTIAHRDHRAFIHYRAEKGAERHREAELRENARARAQAHLRATEELRADEARAALRTDEAREELRADERAREAREARAREELRADEHAGEPRELRATESVEARALLGAHARGAVQPSPNEPKKGRRVPPKKKPR